MANCSSITLSGIGLECSNAGSVKKIYLAPVTEVSGVTVGVSSIAPYSGETVVTAISMVATKKFKEFSFKRGNASVKNSSTKDVKSGTVETTTTIDIQFNRMETIKRKEFVQLLQGNTYLIYQDGNGLFWFVGYDSYVDITKLDSETGSEIKDFNGYKLSLESKTTFEPYEIQSDGNGVSTIVNSVI